MIFTPEIVMIIIIGHERRRVRMYKERKIMKKKKHIISRVLPGSIGEELELEPGDVLAEINHQPVEDVFDYRYLMNDEYIELLDRESGRRNLGAGSREGL